MPTTKITKDAMKLFEALNNEVNAMPKTTKAKTNDDKYYEVMDLFNGEIMLIKLFYWLGGITIESKESLLAFFRKHGTLTEDKDIFDLFHFTFEVKSKTFSTENEIDFTITKDSIFLHSFEDGKEYLIFKF